MSEEARVRPLRLGVPLLGNLLYLSRSRLGLLKRAMASGADACEMRFGPRVVLVVNDAELAHEVLVSRADQFHKSELYSYLSLVLGQGLLTSEGSFHRRQRRMMAPAMTRMRIRGFADDMVEATLRAQAGWADADTIDVSAEMTRLTLAIVCKTLFSAEVGDDTGDRVGKAVQDLLDTFDEQVGRPPIMLMLPTAANRRGKRSLAELDEVLYGIIRERRNSQEAHDDLLGMLLEAREEGTDAAMSDQQIRDEAMTLFLAGHETTANALCWSLSLLASHPAAMQKVERELSTLGEQPVGHDTLAELPYTLAVLQEAMRLYPPAYAVGRMAREPLELAGYSVAARQNVFINIYGIQHSPRYFEEPEAFRPERFESGDAAVPRGAYLPFGAGPRICIGNHFALMEGQLVLATLLQRLRFEAVDPLPRRPEPTVVLRPDGEVRMRVFRRESRGRVEKVISHHVKLQLK